MILSKPTKFYHRSKTPHLDGLKAFIPTDYLEAIEDGWFHADPKEFLGVYLSNRPDLIAYGQVLHEISIPAGIEIHRDYLYTEEAEAYFYKGDIPQEWISIVGLIQ